MKVFWLLLVITGIILIEAPRLWKGKKWGELLVFSGLLGAGAFMAMAAIFYVDLPNPTKLIERVFTPLSGVIISLLK